MLVMSFARQPGTSITKIALRAWLLLACSTGIDVKMKTISEDSLLSWYSKPEFRGFLADSDKPE